MHTAASTSHSYDQTSYENPGRYAKLNFLTGGILIWFHIHAVAALFQFTWTNFLTALFLYWITVGLGISMGYHRLHTHRGFKTHRLFEYFLAVCGTLTLEGGPVFWVATHRLHHQYSDQPADPHTPRVSGFWAHMGWIVFGDSNHSNTERMGRYAPDLVKDPFYRWLNRFHWVPLTVLGLGLLAVGGWDLVNWAIFLRVIVGLHATWLINSATHIWGSRRFATKDDSKNTWWAALITFGEGWHNNHHAHPTSARHGLTWYEFDPTWISLKLLRALGIVWDVKVAKVSQVPEEEVAA
jgi:fatty-acid desaturase